MSTPDTVQRIYFTNVILIGNVFRRSLFKTAAIDQMMVTHGADPNWRINAPISIHNSRHIDRVSGWFAGINKFEPSKTLPIMQSVLTELLQSGSTVSYDDRKLVTGQIARIERFLNPPVGPQQQSAYDQRVIDAASGYWQSGHYTKAVQNTYVALIEEVQKRVKRPDLDGDGLMRHVFSQDRPVLRISDVPSEQRGYMDLFAGGVLAIRNPLSHTAIEILSFDDAVSLLTFASFLFRALDRAKVETPPE